MRVRHGLFLIYLICLVAGFYLVTHKHQPEYIHEQISTNLAALLEAQERDIYSFENEFAVYTNPFAIVDNSAFPKRVYVNGGLVYWTDNEFLPEYSALKRPDTLYTISGEYGMLLINRRQVVADRDLIEIFSILPVYSVPPVINQYLREELNQDIFGHYEVAISDSSTFSFEYGGRTLFRADIEEQTPVNAEWMGFSLLAIIGLSLFLFVRYGLARWVKQKRLRVGLLVLILVVTRLVLYLYTTNQVSTWELFNPIYFTAGILNPSLGDLLLNGLLVFLGAVALYTALAKGLADRVSTLGQKGGILICVVIAMLNTLLALAVFESVWQLLEHSQLELDISRSIIFDQLRIGAYAFLILEGFTVLLLFSLSQIALRHLPLRRVYKYLIGGLVFGAAVALIQGSAYVYLGIFFVLWAVVDGWDYSQAIDKLRYQTFIFLVLVFGAVALVASIAIYKHNEKDDKVAKEKFANRLLIRNDILGEFYLSEIMQEISQDRYIRTRLLSKILARQNIRQKVKRQFLSSYFNKYDIDVYLFDAAGESLQTEVSPRKYIDWTEEYAREGHTTDYPGIYFIEDREENVRNKYVCFIEIAAYGQKIGYIILDLTLKKYIPSSVFPELLLESKYYVGSKEEFDYAVFKNGEILYKQGRYSFENRLTSAEFQNDKLYTSGLEKHGHHYFGLRTIDNRILVIVSPTYSTQAILANSSFLFLLLVFMSGILFLIARAFLPGGRFNLSTKIQVYLGFSFLLPMLIVSVALINTLNTSYREEIDRSFQKRSYNIAENILEYAEAFFSNKINIDDFANEISQAAAIAQSDLNVYDTNGKLVTTSQPEIFRIGLLSRLLDSKAYYRVRHKKAQNIILDQTIGSLDFKTSYTALRSYKDGSLLAVLSMPYFDSKNHLRRQQVEVFNNLVVIFSAIFLISLFGGNTIVGQLVRPLKQIGDKLRKTSLQETNQPIYYEAQDEIGSLVKEYNAMLVKLEESKASLAASQKESAWKEIARQVAHEIKNPLTPMRLKIQQMMRSFSPEAKEYRTCEALIGQIDSLSSIADSFSEFAKMPAPNNEVIEVISSLNRTMDIYQSNEVTLRKSYEVENVHVHIDPKVFSRILTNILLNAIQSEAAEHHEIGVAVRQAGEKVIISVADSGAGIPDEQKEKIFTPYFSTKSEGSGIGLAVAKKGIENAGGNIWFESEEGKGTTFYISLPVYQV